MLLSKSQFKSFIKSQAIALGFQYCGFAEATFLEDDAHRLEKWLHLNRHGKMQYMENHFDKRVNPSLLVPGAKSVITLMMNYYPEQQQTHAPFISKYAYGKDYHLVIREKLHQLLYEIRMHIGDIDGRGFVDSAPVLERSWAVRSGLGWIGKNGNLLTKQSGSFYFIATLITDLEIEPDAPFSTDHCGTCTRCIDACPTEAILPNKEINGSKCISYFTIELKDEILPDSFKGKFNNWMFGCDVCQDVCPWNRFSKPHHEPAFEPKEEIIHFDTKDWEMITEENFNRIFKDSPLKRTKWKNIQRNLKFIQP
jgi:epoxyqueuosine reductase